MVNFLLNLHTNVTLYGSFAQLRDRIHSQVSTEVGVQWHISPSRC